MRSSGQFTDDSTEFMECVDCGTIAEVLVRFDAEAIQKWAFDCPTCGSENRPNLDEPDPDAERDNHE